MRRREPPVILSPRHMNPDLRIPIVSPNIHIICKSFWSRQHRLCAGRVNMRPFDVLSTFVAAAACLWPALSFPLSDGTAPLVRRASELIDTSLNGAR